MAQRNYLSPQEDEIQSYLAQVKTGLAGQNPRAQTMARSEDPALARQGLQMQADRENESARNNAQILRDQADQQREAAAQQREQDRSMRERQQESERQQAISVRSGAAQGMKTETDVVSGKRTIATHPDGVPVYEAGPIEPPKVVGQTATTLTDPDGSTRTLPDYGIMQGAGGDGDIGQTGLPVGAPETQAVIGQKVRDDRGNVSIAEVPMKTDKDTGRMTYTQKNETSGRTEEKLGGVDLDVQSKAQRAQQVNDEAAAASMEANTVAQRRAAFIPAYDKAKQELEEAKAAAKGLPDGYVARSFKIHRITNRLTGESVPVDDKTRAEIQKADEQAQQRLERAKKAFEPLNAQHETLTSLDQAAKARELKAAGEKKRFEAGLPAGADWATEALAKEAGDITETTAQQQDQQIQEAAQPTAADTSQAPSPTHLDALKGIPGVTVKEEKLDVSGSTITSIDRNGKWIGTVDKDADGNPYLSLSEGAMNDADVAKVVRDAGTSGMQIYLRPSKNRMKPADEARALATLNQTIKDPALHPQNGAPADALQKAVEAQGMTPSMVKAKVAAGDLSVQAGESILNLYGDTLKTPNLWEKKEFASEFQKWRDGKETTADAAMVAKNGPGRKDRTNVGYKFKEATTGAMVNADEEKRLRMDFIREKVMENRGKPGWTRDAIKRLYDQDPYSEKDFWGKRKNNASTIARSTANDVGASMLGLLGKGAVGLGAAEMAILGDKEAKKTLSELTFMTNRDTANFTAGLKKNLKVMGTEDGKQISRDLTSKLARLQTAINEQADNPSADRSKLDAAEADVRKAALTFHQRLIPDKDWPVTDDNLNPAKDPALARALAGYNATGDPRYWDLYKERLIASNGRRQQSKMLDAKMSPDASGFEQSFTGAMYSGWQEPASELAFDALALATGGSAKAVQVAAKGARVGSMAARVGRAAGLAVEGLAKIDEIGIAHGTLQNPLTLGQRARNAGVRFAQGSIGEGSEEILTEAGSDNPDFIGAFTGGAIAPVGLAPIGIIRHAMNIDGRVSDHAIADANTKWADSYNSTMAGMPGFEQVTPETAAVARHFIPADGYTASMDHLKQSAASLQPSSAEVSTTVKVMTPERRSQLESNRAKIQERLADPALSDRARTNLEGSLQNIDQRLSEHQEGQSVEQRMRIISEMENAATNLSQQAEVALDAARAVQQADPARKTFLTGIAKVAAGNDESLTGNERKAIGGARTASGADYFDETSPRPRLTAEAMEEVSQEVPAFGHLFLNSESYRAAVASGASVNLAGAVQGFRPTPIQTNEPNIQRSAGVQGNPSPSVPVQAVPAGSNDNAIQGTRPAEGQAQVARLAAMDAAEYEALRSEQSDLPDISTVVRAAREAGAPVSASMERLAGDVGPVAPQDASGPDAARTVADQVREHVEELLPSLKGRIEVTDESRGSGGAILDIESGKIQLPLDDVRREIRAAGGDVEKTKKAIAQFVTRHEAVHAVQVDAVRSIWQEAGSAGTFGDFFTAYYDQLSGEIITDASEKVAREIYGPEQWDAIPSPSLKAAEFVRMLVESKLDPEKHGEFSELFRVIQNNGKESMLAQLIRKAIEVLKGMSLSDAAQEHVANIEALYRELVGEKGNVGTTTEEAATPARREGLNVEVDGDTARIYDGETLISEVPADQADAEMQSLKDALESPLRITGLAIQDALSKMDKVPRKLRLQLEGISEDISGYLETLPAEDRRQAIDDAIATWLAEQQAPKRSIDVPAKTRAYEILNSGDYPALSAIFQSGTKIEPRPNLISLILARKKAGAKLTETEQAHLRNNPEYDGALFQNQFTNSGTGKVAREVLALITAKAGEGSRPDVAAGYVKEGSTASDMWQQLDKELRSIANGTMLEGKEQDPFSDRTQAEIDQYLSKGPDGDTIVKQQQDDAFDAANSSANGDAFDVADFTTDHIGSTVRVDGEEMKVTAVQMDSLGLYAESVTLDDHKRFGRQVLTSGDVLYIEGDTINDQVDPDALFSPHSREEKEEVRKFFEGSPVATLTGQEFQKIPGIGLVDRVVDWFKSEHQGKVENPTLGTVLLDKRGVKDSMSHGIGAKKASAFGAVPEVIRQGAIIDHQTNWKGRGYDTYVIAAPVEISGIHHVMAVVIEKHADNRFYLHEAYITESLQKGLLSKTGALQTPGAQSGDIPKLLQSYFPVNTSAKEAITYEAGSNTLRTLTGPRTDEEWSQYPERSGTLGVARADMPQVKAGDRSALVQYLRTRGVNYEKEDVLPGTLKPTQAEYSREKVNRARQFATGNRSILVSADHHIVDGHHEWMMHLADAPKAPISVIRLDAPIENLLPMVGEFPSAGTAGGKEQSMKSPASEPNMHAFDAVQTALEKMPPKFRGVYEDVQNGMSPADVMKKHQLISERAVENILNQVRSRLAVATKAAEGEMKPIMRDGKIDGGRPDLALSTLDPVSSVDQIRNESGVQDVRGWDEVNAQAEQMIQKDYAGTYDTILEKARTQDQLKDVEVSAAKMLIARETLAGKAHSAADRVKLAMLIHGYRDIGTEAARSLAMRRDPQMKPAQRHAQFIAEALFTPDQETRERMRKRPKQAESILQNWMKRVDAIEAELKSQGIDIRAALAKYNEADQRKQEMQKESPRAAAVIDQKVRELSAREKNVIEAIRSGAMVSKAAFITGMSTEQVKSVYSQFVKDVRKAMTESAKRYLSSALASPAADTMSMILEDLGIPMLEDIDDTAPDFAKRQEQKRKEEKRQKQREKKAARPETPATKDLTPEQQAKLDDAFERFQNAPPSTWKTFWQQEYKTLGPMIGQKAFTEFRGELLKPWRDLWQTEMDGIAKPSARMSFDEWAAKPATQERFKPEKDMFAEPINETTGSFDIHDPRDIKVVMEALLLSKATLGEKVMEAWRSGILTGPQTHIVNTGSNLINVAYNLLPKRATEATINTILGTVGQGSKDGATFSEFAPMARNLRKGVQLAAKNALKSWELDWAGGKIFESYASAKAVQLDFNGVGTEFIPPALSGKFGKVMRSLSFRAMTSADIFMKSLFGQIETAAQAHRMAKSEKLEGEAYDKRMTELMEPGSVAWLRAIDSAKRVTFQEDIDGTNPRAIYRLDQLAELAKTGRAMPWLGMPLTFFLPFIDTPTNVFKLAVEMSPLGGFLAVIDGTRALRRKIFAGKLTKEDANAEAAKLYDRARLVEDLTNQTIAWTMFFALQGLTAGDDDDDESLPVITGTVPYKTTKRGERDNAYAVMPPQTIRLGNVQFSYARVEPFATALASMVDLHQEMNRAGGFKPGVASAWLARFKDQMKDKTFLQGVSNLLNAVEDPDRWAERLGANIVTGFVPNIVRQPLREADTKIRDSNPSADDGFFTSVAKRVGYSIVPQAAPAKTDVWGNEVKVNRGADIGGTKVTDMAWRILDPLNVQIAPDIDPIDRWIFKWNQMEADSAERVAPAAILNYITAKVDGKSKKIALTHEEQAQANRDAGKAAREALGDGWDNKPHTPENAAWIREVVSAAQKSVRANLRVQKLREAEPSASEE